MLKQQKKIEKKFTELLKQFLSEQNESTLAKAYELGRRALSNSVGELQVLRMYHQSLQSIDFFERKESDKLTLAMDFLSEFLAPYEMRQRGFKDLLDELNNQNKQLIEEVNLRKEAEKELKNSKEYFQQLIENTQDIITVIDYEGNIMYVSSSLKRVLGHDTGRIMKENIINLILSEDREKLLDVLESLKTSDESKTVEFRIKHADDSYRYLESIAQNVREHNAIIVNSRDVTERVVAHQKLLESEKKLRTAQHIAQLGNWEWDFKNDKIYWSEELCEIFGIGKEEYPHNSEEYKTFLPPGNSDKIKELFDEAVLTGKEFEFERKIFRADGEVRIMHSRGEIVKDGKGDIVKIVGTGQDITRLKEVENQLRHYSRQLKDYMANEERSREEERIRIAREIHDELGQMLTVLKLDVSMMMMEAQRGAESGNNDAFKKDIDLITKRIDTIIKSVQRIAKELRPDIFDHLGLEEALQWQAKEFEKRTGIKHTLKSEVNDLEVLSDERSIAIYRIFQETLTNILRHANATRVDIQLKQNNEQLILIVKDNGDGIDDEKIRKSSSLGIVGMKERSQLLHGDITFSGKKGKGTTVTLSIPLKETGMLLNHKKVI